jgi:hypothetical protein
MSSSFPPSTAAIASSLLVSGDLATIKQISECMRGFAITTEVCPDVPTALALIKRSKFEAVIVDLKAGEAARRLLEQIRISPSNKTAVTFAIANYDDPAMAMRSLTNFVMEPPLSKTSVDRTLKAAYGLIVRERRRSFRCPLTIPVTVKKRETEVSYGEMVNISEGGLALTSSVPLKIGTQLEVVFTLPSNGLNEFAIESEVCWYLEQGRAGLHFTSLSHSQQSAIQAWLSHKLEESLPEEVANKFLKAKDL